MLLAEKGNKKVLLNLAHINEEKWSGGKFRSTQTKEIFEDAGYTITQVEEPQRPGKWRMLLFSLSAIVKFGIYRPFCMAGLRTSGYLYFYYSYLTTHFPEVQTYIIEGTGFGNLQGVAMLKRFGKKVLLLPINVESLAPYPHEWTHTLPILKRLKEEVPYYNQADAVFCISLEEVWLLSILGAKAYALLYFPPRDLLAKIEIRKNQRMTRSKQGLFYFANFYNSPNYFGFKQFVKDRLYTGSVIKVAGIGIETIAPLVKDNPSFILLGELSTDDLEEQLISCEKVVLNHFPTSGMLTRIPELLLSGIPVVGNDAALKAYGMLPAEAQNVDLAEFLSQQVKTSATRLLSMV